jgi:nitrite reductase (NADH) small subunit
MKYKVGTVGDFNKKSCHLVDVKGRKLGIYKIDDQYYAILNACPHKGAPLCMGSSDGTMLPSLPNEYKHGLENRVVRCPWHGYEFEIETGEPIFGTTNKKVPAYSVSEENGELYVKF